MSTITNKTNLEFFHHCITIILVSFYISCILTYVICQDFKEGLLLCKVDLTLIGDTIIDYKAELLIKRELYIKAIECIEGLEVKGKLTLYTSLNGHMFSYFSTDGHMALRIPKDQIEDFLAEYKTTRDIQYGTIMKEYAKIPNNLLYETPKLVKYIRISLAYIKSLKPK